MWFTWILRVVRKLINEMYMNARVQVWYFFFNNICSPMELNDLGTTEYEILWISTNQFGQRQIFKLIECSEIRTFRENNEKYTLLKSFVSKFLNSSVVHAQERNYDECCCICYRNHRHQCLTTAATTTTPATSSDINKNVFAFQKHKCECIFVYLLPQIHEWAVRSRRIHTMHSIGIRFYLYSFIYYI